MDSFKDCFIVGGGMAAILWLSISFLRVFFIANQRKWARKEREEAISSIELTNSLFDKLVVDDSSHAFKFLENDTYQGDLEKLERAVKVLGKTLKQELIDCFNPFKP